MKTWSVPNPNRWALSDVIVVLAFVAYALVAFNISAIRYALRSLRS